MIEKIIKKAISYLGVKEPTGDDQFIKLYNQLTNAGFSMTVAWCAIFVTAIARLVGASTSLIPTFASCDLGVDWFDKKGRYEKSKYYGGTYTPKRGDIVFYSSKHTQSDSTHVGYAVETIGNTLKAIEGNKSDAVGYRTINLNDKYIIGYGRVADFAGGTATVTPTPNTQTPTGLATVKGFQTWLNDNFASGLAADGAFGKLSKKAAVKAWQTTANKTLSAGLAVDGSFGAKSKAFGNRALVKNGSKGTFVYILQGVLCANGYYSGELDGNAGSITVAGIKAYQKANGLTVDGECGANTWYSLFN